MAALISLIAWTRSWTTHRNFPSSLPQTPFQNIFPATRVILQSHSCLVSPASAGVHMPYYTLDSNSTGISSISTCTRVNHTPLCSAPHTNLFKLPFNLYAYESYPLGEPRRIVIQEMRAESEQSTRIWHPHLQVWYPDGLVAEHLSINKKKSTRKCTLAVTSEKGSKLSTQKRTLAASSSTKNKHLVNYWYRQEFK